MQRSPVGYRRRLASSRALAAIVFTCLATWGGLSCSSPTDAKGPPVAVVRLTTPASQLFVGATLQLAVVLEDENGNMLTGRPVAWTSSGEGIATVTSAGLVRGLAPDTVTVTATSEGRSAQTRLTVLAPVASVQIDSPATMLVEGGSIQLQATTRDHTNNVLSGRHVRWTSSNEAIVSVSPTGMATAHALGGPVTITATCENRTATLSLTVVVRVASVAVVPASHEMTTGSTVQLFATPYDAANQPLTGRRTEWSSSHPIIAPVSPLGVVTAMGEGGPITITATVEGKTATSQIRVTGRCSTILPITVEQGSIQAALSGQDCLIDGFYNDLYGLTVATTTTYRIDMASGAFDTYLVVTDRLGNVIGYDDDGGGNLNSRLNIQLSPGEYIVWATSYSAYATGPYAITLTVNRCGSSASLALGGSATGTLATNDCMLRDGSFADRWMLQLESPATVRFDLTSTAFDPYLIVTDANGDVIATDDDGGTGSNARVDVSLPAGVYIAWANSYLAARTGDYAIAASTVSGATLNLQIDGLYLTQSSQRFSGTVPLIAGRAAYLRVFGRANLTNSVTPPVRVRLFYGGTLTDSIDVPATTTDVPTVLAESTRDRSWNVLLPAAAVRPGLAITAEIDPAGAVAEADEADNRYPVSGTPRSIDVRSATPLPLTLVPVRQSANNLTGNVNAGNAELYAGMTRALFPFPSVDLVVRAPYTTTLPPLDALDGNGSWYDLLSELLALRTAEAPTRNYYGVAKVTYTSGIAGMAIIGAPVSIGWDGADAGMISSHELGHNFGRYHAPCGGAGGPDGEYPYPNGSIGVTGFDARTSTIVPRAAPDIMSYCDEPWISDYTYEAVLAFRAAPPAVAGALVPRTSLLVWGRMSGTKVVLEPAFLIQAAPSVPRRTGPWRLVGRDANGTVLFSYAFAPDEIADGPRAGAVFAFTLPVDSASADRLQSLEVTGPQGADRRESRRVARDPAKSELRLARTAGDRTQASWDASRYPMAMLRDARTGEVLSFVRDAQVTLPPGAAVSDLELLLSDGVRTVRERVAPR